MKQVRFKSIRLEGFRSFVSPVDFQFGTTGLHLIKGNNGEGKTTIFSALLWGLYKLNLNETNNSRIATFKWRRNKGYLGTRVIVSFRTGGNRYLVARHMDYKGKTKGLDGESALLIFKKSGKDTLPFTAADIVNDELYKSDGQAYLDRILGIDAKTFLNSIIFGQRLTRLMGSKDADNRKLFENLFDVDFVERLKEKAEKKLKANNEILQGHETNLARVESLHIQLTKQLENAANIVAEFKKQRKERLAEIRTEHEAKDVELQEVQDEIALLQKKVAKADNTTKLNDLLAQADEKREALSDVKQRLRHVQDDIADLQRQLSNCELDLNNYKLKLAKVTDTCPTCGHPLDTKQVKAAKKTIQEAIDEGAEIQTHLNGKIKTLQESEKNIAKEVTVANNVLGIFMGSYQEAKEKGVTYDSTETKLQHALRKEAVLTEALEALVNTHTKEKERKAPTVNIEELTAELEQADAQMQELAASVKKHKNLSIRLEWWIKTAFSANGLKAFVFSAMLNKLNEHLATYTEYFGYTVIFGIDMTKQSKPFYSKVTLDGEHECEYGDLSGGQKQKIDLCIAFAMHDVVAVKSAFNIIVFDEAAEGLDTEAQEMFDTLLRIKAETKAVYVISHNNQMDLSGATEYEVTGGNKTTSSIQ